MYFLHTTSFATLEQVQNYKSLDSYKYFIAGWVIEHKWKMVNDCCLITGKVNHSYAISTTPLLPWVVVRSSGAVACGHCTCMAGLSEMCSHVGALLFWLEFIVRKREEKSCTSGPNQWLEPKSIKQVPYLELINIDFTSAKSKYNKCTQNSVEKVYVEEEPELTTVIECASEPTESQLSVSQNEHMVTVHNCEAEGQLQADLCMLFDNCLQSRKLPILFSVEDEPYCASFCKPSTHLPLALQSLFDPAHSESNYLQLVEEGERMPGVLDITPLQQQNLEELTRGQASSRLWMRYRAGRITASRLYQAVHTDAHKPALSLVFGICYPESAKFTTKATRYGCEHERKAISCYQRQTLHQQLQIKPAGLMLFLQKSCFGASPDSFLECACCGPGVLEVKCPYCLKDESFDAVSKKKSSFCLQKSTDGKLTLKKDHPYYYQCQMQILVTSRQYCDFVVWAGDDKLHIETIKLERSFIEHQIKKAEELFWLAIVPELLGKWYSRDHTKLPEPPKDVDVTSDFPENDDGTWCYCQEVKGGSMIKCENPSCPFKWFHMSCLRMKKAPKTRWFCPSCHFSKRQVTKSKD